MNKAYDTSRYGTSSYDDFFCLKPPALLWIAVAFFGRTLLAPLVAAAGSISGASTPGFLSGSPSIGSIIAAIPALFVLIALLRRGPGASPVVRWIFFRTRLLLIASFAIDCLGSLEWNPLALDISDRNLPSFLALLIEGFFLAYVLASRRVRDALSDFPL